jgi:hypothetical protein
MRYCFKHISSEKFILKAAVGHKNVADCSLSTLDPQDADSLLLFVGLDFSRIP